MSESESVISSSQEYDNEDCCEFNEEANSSYTEDDDNENTCTIRGKWIFDGSQSIDDMIACLQKEIEILTDLKESGWHLVDTVHDDWAILRRDVEEPLTT